MSGVPLLPITLTLTARAMEKILSTGRTNRGGERREEGRADENREQKKTKNTEIIKRRK